MDGVGWLLAIMLVVCTALVLSLPFAVHHDFKYGQKFQAECVAKGGVVYHPYKSERICLPVGTVIPVEVK